MKNLLFLCEEDSIDKKEYTCFEYLYTGRLKKDLEEVLNLTIKQQIDTIICSKEQITLANRILWESPFVERYILIDTDNPYCIEDVNKSAEKLWDVVAIQGGDNPLAQSGWRNSDTNELFSLEEMEEWVSNSVAKIFPCINKGAKVLEIGVASGLTCVKVAPLVDSYVGVDISEETLKKTRATLKNCKINNVNLFKADALGIDKLEIDEVEIVIINSVAQYFPGYNYFIECIRKSIECMKDKGVIFLGDIIDLELKKELLEEKKRSNKMDLHYSKTFMKELPAYLPEIVDVKISAKQGNIDNELKKYRYDVILQINKNISKRNYKKSKYQYAMLADGFSLDELKDEYNH